MNSSDALAPLSALYGAAVRARLALYRRGLLKSERVGAPVVSVGNLTAGGTGKTPLVAWLARAAAREGLKPCVLTRGYGRRDERERVVVSDGARILADAETGGDEPRLLAEQLLGVAAVVSDADRASAARWALDALGVGVFILDDGFQHLRLARDLDVVTLDATAPWGGGRLLPRGLLREPRGGIARADCVVITRADMAEDLHALRAEVAKLARRDAPVFEGRLRTTGLRPLGTTRGDGLVQTTGTPAAAFCATGNPPAFFEHLRRGGHVLRLTRAFKDHHAFSQHEIDALCRDAERAGAGLLLTTAKDAVKLRALASKLPVFVVEVELEIEGEERLLGLVRAAVGGGARGGVK